MWRLYYHWEITQDFYDADESPHIPTVTAEELKDEDPPPVRLSGEWMSVWDDRILEYINAKGHGSAPQLAESGYLRVTRQHVNTRLNRLADHGLLEPLGNGVFIMTDRGRRYLHGEFDAAEDRPDDLAESPENPDEAHGDGES